MIGVLKDACPSRTVPICKTTKEDLIPIRSMSNNIYPQSAAAPGFHVTSSSCNFFVIYFGILDVIIAILDIKIKVLFSQEYNVIIRFVKMVIQTCALTK